MKSPKAQNGTNPFEAALVAGAAASHHSLRLFVSGTTPRSARAIQNLRAICDEDLHGRYDLEVIDVYQHPEFIELERIVVTPTLIRRLPASFRRVIGDLTDKDEVLAGLDIGLDTLPRYDRALSRATISPEAASATREDLLDKIRDLQERFGEAEDTLRALRAGEVDAIVVTGPAGERVYTLKGADEAYRVILERMADGALTVTVDGLILFSNEQFASLARRPLAQVIGSRIQDFVVPEDAAVLSAILTGTNRRKSEVWLRTDGSASIPVYLAAENLILDGADQVCLVITDLSEQKRNEKTVAAEKLARSILEQAAEAIVVVDPEGRITRANGAAERLAGSPVMLRGFDEMFRIGQLSGAPYPFQEILAAAKRFQVIESLEATALAADGRKIELLLSIAALSDPDAGLMGCVLTLTDITERRKAEARLQLFKALIDGVQDYGIFVLDPEGFVLSWNEGAERLKGYSESEIVGRHFSCFYTPEDLAANQPENGLRIARANGKFEGEGWRVRRDGSRFWASVLITVLQDNEGKPRGFSELTRDITERRHAEELLRESERSLRAMADAMPQIVWTARADGFLEYYNRQWYDFTGSSEDQAGDDTWAPILHPDDLPRVLQGWSTAVEFVKPFEMEFRFRDRKSGGYRWYLGRALPIRDQHGRITNWVGTCTDIDEHIRLSQQLEMRVVERTAELRQSLADKITLLQEVHHRVKNNLQVVCSLLSMQIGSLDSSLSARPLHDAHSRVLAMALIHEEVYQSDTLADLNFGSYVERLSTQLFNAYCVDTSKVGIELSVEPIVLTLDEAIPCGLILNELLSNSLKHAFSDGRQGLIRVSVRTTENDRVELTVADNGIGLPPGFRLEESQSLGLQVVGILIHQLRAEISVSGNGGSTFTFHWKPETQTTSGPGLI